MHREPVVVMGVAPLIAALVAWLCFAACASSDQTPVNLGTGGSGASAGSGGSGASAGTGGSGASIGASGVGGISLDGSSSGAGGGAGADGGPWRLPPGFTEGTFGGYKLGERLDPNQPVVDAGAGASDGGNNCGTTITGVVRDFQTSHPDFEDYCCDLFGGLTARALGADKKPIYGQPGETDFSTGAAEFDQWYRNVPGVNLPFLIQISLQPNGGVYTFHSESFFPLDSAGFGNEDLEHNYHFTTELHIRFRYAGGEVFSFTGDDDVFVFINGQRVIDLGGVHNAENGEVVLDQIASSIGITPGNLYDLDLFHAERYTSESNFRIDTTLEFVNCGYVVPEPPR
jgi:fibro-slime domain-containing protein